MIDHIVTILNCQSIREIGQESLIIVMSIEG